MTEAEKQVEEAVALLEQIKEDSSVPRNIRKTAGTCVEILTSEDPEMELTIKASTAIEMLEECTQDPNCPLHTRTKVYYVLTRLELPQEEFAD